MPQREEQTKETEGNGTERGATGGGSKAVLCISRGILLQGRCLRAQLLLPSPAHSSQTWTRSAAALGKQKVGSCVLLGGKSRRFAWRMHALGFPWLRNGVGTLESLQIKVEGTLHSALHPSGHTHTHSQLTFSHPRANPIATHSPSITTRATGPHWSQHSPAWSIPQNTAVEEQPGKQPTHAFCF